MRLGGMPDELEDRRKREDQIDRDLRRHFTDALKDRGVTVAARRRDVDGLHQDADQR